MSQLTKKAFIYSGFTSDVEGDGDPNIHSIMRASNVKFNSNPGMQELFYKSLQYCVAEMCSVGSISEEAHDSLDFIIGVDYEVNLFVITSQSPVIVRSHPTTNIDTLQIRMQKAVQNLE